MTPAPPLADDDCYLALQARDARFDGCFFTGVASTGIYCRPVCSVRAPKRENCRFFRHAAQAESAGFRPCLRCRPELAPHLLAWSTQDGSAILAQQAARLLDEPDAWNVAPTLAAAPAVWPELVEGQSRGPHVKEGSHKTGRTSIVENLAARLGVSDRHVRRLFEAHFGVSPLQYLQTRRLHTAKQLLTDTALPVTQIALMSGYQSLRRFNAAFVGHYQLNPTQLRRRGVGDKHSTGNGDGTGVADMASTPCTTVRLGYRPPYDCAAMLGFFSKRAIPAMEFIAAGQGIAWATRTFGVESAGAAHAGWIQAGFDDARSQLVLKVSDSLRGVLPLVIRRVRALYDLDADPRAINSVLHAHFPQGDGLRVPGALDGYELAVRAVLGQQITVAAARTLAQRLVEKYGQPVATPWPGLNRLFPSPAVLAAASGDGLGQLGIVRQRQAALVALARAVRDGALQLHGGADVHATVARLKTLPGIGDWTAQYIAMRALRWPDAFPAGDVALHKALGVQGLKQPARLAEAASSAWRPWRSYAVIRAWSGGVQAVHAVAAVHPAKPVKPAQAARD